MIEGSLVYFPLLLLLAGLYWRGRLSNIGVMDALAYWKQG